jgi:hypothetical protein
VFRVDPVTGAPTKITTPGIFEKPTALAFAPDGSIVVADEKSTGGAIRRVDPGTGAITDVALGGLLAGPTGLAVDGANLVVADGDAFSGAGGVIRIALSGGAQTQLSAGGVLGDTGGIAAGVLPSPPEGIAVNPPVLGETVAVQPAAGTVRYARPRKGRGNGRLRWQILRRGALLPAGTIFDTVRGRVVLTVAMPSGGTQAGTFFGGWFAVKQAKSTGRTDLILAGSGPRCKSRASASARRRNQRRLWGDAHGRFRTRGRNSSATVRGTKWLVEERCRGTLTRVARGVVDVRDAAKRRTVAVRAGKSYLAKRR